MTEPRNRSVLKTAICSDCGEKTWPAKDGLCRPCRLIVVAASQRKYIWTPAMDEELRRIYRISKNKSHLSRARHNFGRQYNLPPHIIGNRAQTLGLRCVTQNRWTEQEMEMLREMDGQLSIKQMAKRLRRSESSVKNRLFLMDLSARVTEGYSCAELAGLFGVHHNKIARWVGLGWLRLDDYERVTHESIESFVWRHMDEFRFAACEEWWLKTMLNPRLGSVPVPNVGSKEAA